MIFNENLARVAEQYLKKGSKVYIEGQLQTRKWTGPAGPGEVHDRGRAAALPRRADPPRQPRRRRRWRRPDEEGGGQISSGGDFGRSSPDGAPAGPGRAAGAAARATTTSTTTSRSRGRPPARLAAASAAPASPLSFRIARSASPEPITADVFGWVRRALQPVLHRQRLWVPGSAARPRNDSGRCGTPHSPHAEEPRSGVSKHEGVSRDHWRPFETRSASAPQGEGA